MHIEVFQGRGEQNWYWHFVSQGRTTANNESFPTQQHAMRAAKGVVRGIVKKFMGSRKPWPVAFTPKRVGEVYRIDWSRE